MGTLAALCMGVADSGTAASTRERGLVGRYRSIRGSAICRASTQLVCRKPCHSHLHITQIVRPRTWNVPEISVAHAGDKQGTVRGALNELRGNYTALVLGAYSSV